MRTITTLLAILILCGLVPMFGCKSSDLKKLRDDALRKAEEEIKAAKARATAEVQEAWDEVFDRNGERKDKDPEAWPESGELIYGNEKVHAWKETLKIANIKRSGQLVIWDYVGPTPITLGWPDSRLGRASVGFRIIEDGEPVATAGMTDWLLDGNINYQVAHNFQSHRGGDDYKFSGDWKEWKPQSGTVIEVFVSGRNYGPGNVRERSNKLTLIW